MFVVERGSVGAYSTNEAVVALDDVGHESFKAEKYNLSIGAHDGAVSGLQGNRLPWALN
jgi:hypothetical protein